LISIAVFSILLRFFSGQSPYLGAETAHDS
jgi:hypothetical protein